MRKALIEYWTAIEYFEEERNTVGEVPTMKWEIR